MPRGHEFFGRAPSHKCACAGGRCAYFGLRLHDHGKSETKFGLTPLDVLEPLRSSADSWTRASQLSPRQALAPASGCRGRCPRTPRIKHKCGDNRFLGSSNDCHGGSGACPQAPETNEPRRRQCLGTSWNFFYVSDRSPRKEDEPRVSLVPLCVDPANGVLRSAHIKTVRNEGVRRTDGDRCLGNVTLNLGPMFGKTVCVNVLDCQRAQVVVLRAQAGVDQVVRAEAGRQV